MAFLEIISSFLLTLSQVMNIPEQYQLPVIALVSIRLHVYCTRLEEKPPYMCSVMLGEAFVVVFGANYIYWCRLC